MIIHQKLSKVMARDIFGITDNEVLDAVGCHTTLRANATQLDLVLFVADKIAWDQQGTPPYLKELHHNLKNHWNMQRSPTFNIYGNGRIH
ncbi:hydrolase (HAD superfamily) [Paenibacillus alvei DSM 29]|nr:hydrolase (HAD superfamily) [Paenibacillus alvei DSM 29]